MLLLLTMPAGMLSSPDNAEALVSFFVSLSYPSSHSADHRDQNLSQRLASLLSFLRLLLISLALISTADSSACAYLKGSRNDTCYTEKLTLVSLGELTVHSLIKHHTYRQVTCMNRTADSTHPILALQQQQANVSASSAGRDYRGCQPLQNPQREPPRGPPQIQGTILGELPTV